MIRFTLPVHTVSEANSHAHWRQRQKRAKEHRWVCCHAAQAYGAAEMVRPSDCVRVSLTRIAPRKLDSDNLQGAMKHCRDGVADAMNRDDRDRRITWLYAQRRGAKGQYGIEVQIERASAEQSLDG